MSDSSLTSPSVVLISGSLPRKWLRLEDIHQFLVAYVQTHSRNQLAKDLEIMFENYVEGFEAACVVSRNAKKFRPGDTAMQRAGDVLYRPQHYHMNIEEGLDLSGKTPTALVQRLVPSVFKEPKNILYTLDAREMRDPEHKTEAGRAAGMRLAAQIDSDLISMVTQRATNVITMADSTTGSQGRDLWNCAAGIDATMTAIGVPQGINRRSFWNPFNYKDLAGELGHRAYAQGATLTAYEKAQIPPVASFDSYKTDISGRVPKGTATSLTLAAEPAHKVEAKDANDMPVDTNMVENAMSKDLRNAVAKNLGASGAAKYLKANSDYANVYNKVLNKNIANKLNKASSEASPELINTVVLSRKPSDVKRIWSALDDKGKDAMRAAYVSKIAEKAGDSPAKFITEVNKLKSQSGGEIYNTIFSGKHMKELDALHEVLQQTARSDTANVVTQTGQSQANRIRTIGATATLGVSMGLEAGFGAMMRLYESKAARNALLRLANTKAGTPAYERALNNAANAIRPILSSQITAEQ